MKSLGEVINHQATITLSPPLPGFPPGMKKPWALGVCLFIFTFTRQ